VVGFFAVERGDWEVFIGVAGHLDGYNLSQFYFILDIVGKATRCTMQRHSVSAMN
jgi:hypothetical protein